MSNSQTVKPWGLRGTAGVSIASELTLDKLSFAFNGERNVLSDFSLTIKPGEILCLLGQSGSGKTTLLRLIAGLERPRSGQILFDNRPVAAPGCFVPAEQRGIGFVFQDFALFPHLTLAENVAFGIRGMNRQDKQKVALGVLARVGLDACASNYPHEISGGEQQRIALARAIAPRPGLLLMDEPFSALDRTLRQRVRQETLAVIRETRATSIIVTHDPEEALLMADRIALLRDGKIIQVGRPQDIFRQPETRDSALFFGNINQIRITVREGVADTPFGAYSPPAALAHEASLYMCFRPAALALAPLNCGAAARISNCHFLGDRQIIELVIHGHDTPLQLSTTADICLKAGQDIALTLDPDQVHFFTLNQAN